MKIIDFLRQPKKPGDMQSQITAMEESISRLSAERREAEKVAEQHAPKRAEMLLSDATEEAILEADHAAEIARLRLERIELAEVELTERLNRARDAAERTRRAAECEHSAAQIEAAVKGLDGPIAALAAAFTELAKSIPAENLIQKYSDGHRYAQPAAPEDIARALVGNALYVAAPKMFAMARASHVFSGWGAGVERALKVHTYHNDMLTSYNAGLAGEDCTIHDGALFADQIIVGPLRRRAASAREGFRTSDG